MIDLHTHSIASDGDKTSKELIDLAINKGLSALAITDHDTVDALEEAANYSKNKNILFVPGVELDTDINKGEMHILGLFIDYNNKNLLNLLLSLKKQRDDRNMSFIKYLNEIGFEISLEELQKISGGKIISKPHFAKILIQKKYVISKTEVFDKYFNQPPLNQFKKTDYSPKDIISIIKQANGIAILAHPQSLKLEHYELIKKIEELKSYGLDGIECYHSNQTLEQMQEFKEIANQLGLIITKGSDYHGPVTKPDIELGTGKNNNIISNNDKEIIDNLLKYIKSQ